MKKLIAITMTIVLSSCFSFPNLEKVETLYESNHFCHQVGCENIIFPDLLVGGSSNTSRLLEPINPSDPSVNAIPTPYKPNKTFTYNYFKNLRSNTFNNVHYSYTDYTEMTVAKCPFVAIGMYFSYLDVYWNDLIINNVYQSSVRLDDYNDLDDSFESPGINDNLDLTYEVMDDESEPTDIELNQLIRNFLVEIENYTNTSYLAYLLSLANEINLFPNGYLKSLGLNLPQIVLLINKIIEDSPILQGKTELYYYERSSFSSYSDFENILIDKLSVGDPVILGVPGHVLIAYDYIDGEIIVNKGCKGAHTCETIDEYGENPVTDFYFLELSNEVQHTHNSLYINNNSQSFFNRNYCSCKLMSHNHLYNYELKDDTYHKRQCFCEMFASTQVHVYTHTEHIGLSEYAICGHCNYAKLIDENFTPIV